MTPRKYWLKWNSVLALLLLVACGIALSGCADDRRLIDKTLDARNAALNAKDLDAYVALISPEYVKATPNYDARATMARLFSNMQSIQIQLFRREVTFESPEIARVIQEYKMVFTTNKGKTSRIKSVDHFLLKRHGSWPFTKWLIYQGLDAPAKKDPPPDDASPTPAKESESDESANP